ncbi:MAG: hypothetical protein JWR89_4972 [Tardiphaga sp.]|uniref:hypothetical protein n=1 Tax=Tardiphaga sp. TaxID=1926292 RepID=UPI0026154207|nr:hypothetical protein [Tardiphaga sp.]MDB5505070.1 hypothetical protein [Tardiphaga sp.]
MAEEAFALSPISARPSVPGEADYDAIREAFMETARGRWFLNEYAKRNRHTDTGMVLEAVTRLEASLAAQKAAPTTTSLLEALGAIRAAVRQAKATAIEAMPRVESDETLTAARNGVRIIREIAWTLRECGADIRICDLLDTQVKAIEAGQQSATDTGRDDVLESYDLLMQRIEQLADRNAAAPDAVAKADTAEKPVQPVQSAAETHEASVTPLFRAPVAEAVVETAAAPVAEAVVETAAAPAPEAFSPAAQPETVEAVAEAPAPIVESTAEIAAAMAEASVALAVDQTAAAEPEAASLDAESAEDLAVLDMVAMEMAVQDFSEPETSESETAPSEMVQPVLARSDVAEPEIAQPEAIEAPITFEQIAEVALAPELPQPAVQEASQGERGPEPAYHPSLGAALIANGVIADPKAPASDPLAPIRRMSQAEKIAFFS